MIYVLGLMLAYGICWGALQKVGPAIDFVTERSAFVETLFRCPYCMGFHAGWLSWLLLWGATGEKLLAGDDSSLKAALAALAWSLICSGFCYVAEMAMLRIEPGDE